MSRGPGVGAQQSPVQPPPCLLGLKVSGDFSLSPNGSSPGHSMHIISRLAPGSGGGDGWIPSASVLKTVIQGPEVCPERDILSGYGSVGLLDPS